MIPGRSSFLVATLLALAMSIAMSTLSAWLRLADSTLDCSPWPACHGTTLTIDSAPGVSIDINDTNRGLRATHRIMASLFGVLVVGMATAALWFRREQPTRAFWCTVALALTLVLAWVGMSTPDIQHPIITTINLTGGMCLSLVLFHLTLEQMNPSPAPAPVALISMVSLATILFAVVTGAWVSANYAAGSCGADAFCQMPAHFDLVSAFSPARELLLQGTSVQPSAEDPVILFVHHAMGPIVTFMVIYSGAVAFALRGYQHWMAAPPVALTVLVIVAIYQGSQPTLAAASLHNLLALVLMFTCVYQIHRLRQP